MKISSIMKAAAYVWRAKKVWRKPKQARTLIYDRAGSELLLEYINQKDVEILDLRGESINLYALLKCAFSLELSLANYASKYTSLVRPTVVITFIHNNPDIYKLKNAHPRLVTVFVQNGMNTEFGGIFGYLKNNATKESYQVDYMLTFGAAHGEKYRQYIKGQTMPIGSFKNNLCRPGTAIEAGSLVYISQFRPQPSDPDAAFISNGATSIFYEDFYAAERKLLAYLTSYCERENLRLQVCGAFRQETGPEWEFFNARIGNANWKFIPKSSPYGSYKVIDSAEYVVFVDSALGYESLARGKKTAAFSIRGEALHDATRKFGWPADLPDNGPFWTIHADEREFERVMTYITNVSDEEWEHTRQRYVPDLMEYDSGNTRFVKLMRELGVPLKPEYQTDV